MSMKEYLDYGVGDCFYAVGVSDDDVESAIFMVIQREWLIDPDGGSSLRLSYVCLRDEDDRPWNVGEVFSSTVDPTGSRHGPLEEVPKGEVLSLFLLGNAFDTIALQGKRRRKKK